MLEMKPVVVARFGIVIYINLSYCLGNDWLQSYFIEAITCGLRYVLM